MLGPSLILQVEFGKRRHYEWPGSNLNAYENYTSNLSPYALYSWLHRAIEDKYILSYREIITRVVTL